MRQPHVHVAVEGHGPSELENDRDYPPQITVLFVLNIDTAPFIGFVSGKQGKRKPGVRPNASKVE